MISIDNDREILKHAYKQYIFCIKKKKIADRMPLEIRSDITKTADPAIESLSNPDSTEDSIRKALTSGKSIYGQYCRIIKRTPDVLTPWLKEKMEELVNLLVYHEARYIHILRMDNKGISDISLDNFYKRPEYIVTICKDTSWSTLQAYLFGTLKENKENKKKKAKPACVYITPSGSKYHKGDCRYCKGRELREVYFETAVSSGYSACNCIVPSKKLQDMLKPPVNSKKKKIYMTAFIDESLRDNPWYKYDHSLDPKQLSYSYIICRGRLQSEKEISAENILYRRAALSDCKVRKTEQGAFEAISRVLMLLAFDMNYHSNVIIFTDSDAAAKQWKTSPTNNGMSRLFSDIQVLRVPRNRNRLADAAGRERAFLDVPKQMMIEVDKMITEGKFATSELDFVHRYFKDPEHDIPKLVDALVQIAGSGFSYEINTNPDSTDNNTQLISNLLDQIKENQKNEYKKTIPINSPEIQTQTSFIAKFWSLFSTKFSFISKKDCLERTIV